MLAVDVNVLVSAFRGDAADHDELRGWLEEAVNGDDFVAVSEAVISGVIRVLTHPRVFIPPTPIETAWAQVRGLIAHPNVRVIRPGDQHLNIFEDLCVTSGATGNLVADAGDAATAIEHGLIWVSKDRDFARFARLRRQQPTRRGHEHGD